MTGLYVWLILVCPARIGSALPSLLLLVSLFFSYMLNVTVQLRKEYASDDPVNRIKVFHTVLRNAFDTSLPEAQQVL